MTLNELIGDLHVLKLLEYGEVVSDIEVVTVHPDAGYDYDIHSVDLVNGVLKIYSNAFGREV